MKIEKQSQRKKFRQEPAMTPPNKTKRGDPRIQKTNPSLSSDYTRPTRRLQVTPQVMKKLSGILQTY